MLVDGLPRSSHYRSALSKDVDLYVESGHADKPPPQPQPPDLVEFSPEVELLAAVYDRLGEVIRAVAASAGSKKKPRLKPWTRPVTARDLVRKKRARDNFLHLDSILTFVEDWPAERTVQPVAELPPTTVTATAARADGPGNVGPDG